MDWAAVIMSGAPREQEHASHGPASRLPRGVDAAAWRALFEERVATGENDGGLPRAKAEAAAYESCIVEWMIRNPPSANAPDRCAHCDKPMAEDDALPFLNGAGGHVWLHDRCHAGWMESRRADARKALAEIGLCT